MRFRTFLLAAVLFSSPALRADDIDKRYPLDAQLRVLAADVANPSYRELILKKMLVTDLAAEWQRVATADNPESFLEKHGGKVKVLADADLKRAYERRVKIREDFLNLMREGYARYKQKPPFDTGAKAEVAGTTTKVAGGPRLPISAVLPAAKAEENWPQLRGPTAQGWTGYKGLPVKWEKDGDLVRWKTKVPGQGNSSPIVWGDHIFLTSASERGIERFLHCFRTDGRLLWTRKAPMAPPEIGVRDKNGYATSTPVTDGERVIAFLGSCGLVCWDFKGEQLWHFNDFTIQTTHGTGSSPILYKDLVILVQDQNRSNSIFMALDKRTGKPVWKQTRTRAMTWSTPVVLRIGDRDELIIAGAETVKSYDPLNGKELWSLTGPTHEVVPMIVFGNDLLYSASGRNGPTVALRAGGNGDVTATHFVWRAVRGGPHVPTPIYRDGKLYTFNDTGIASCLDAETGKLLWLERINDRFSASPISAGGYLYVSGESGMTYVLKESDKFEVVAQNDLGAPILASPAVFGGDKLLLRTQEELVCIGAK